MRQEVDSVAKAKTKVSKKKTAQRAPAKKKAANKAKKKITKKTSATKKTAGKRIVEKKAGAKKETVAKKQTATKRKPAATAASKPKPELSAGTTRPPPIKVEPQPQPRIIRKVVNLEKVKIPLDYKPSAKEEYMSPQHLVYFKRKLENWRGELIVESQETLEHLRTETRDVGDEAERASRESDNILELRTRDRYRKLLRKIEEALKRVEEGAYGYCEETGEEIGLGRLEARPIATLTVDAQERREMFQRQFRDDH